MKESLHYKDICLVPEYSKLKSRKQADVSVDFLGARFRLPIIPSNMKCVINTEIARGLARSNHFYIMHRFDVDVLEFVEWMDEDFNTPTVSISVGVGDDDIDLLKEIEKRGLIVDYLTIDIAHGDSIKMIEMLDYIRHTPYFDNVKIIAGNVATVDGFIRLVDHGADAVKVLIGTGGVCSTKNKTGFTIPAYSCVKEIADYKNNLDSYKHIPIIADGGIRENGDIAKAIHAGADMVMAGGLFSRLVDSPAEVIGGHKIYYGSASQYNKGEYKHVEGIKRVLDIDMMTYADKLKEIEQDLQSAVSYAGGEFIYDIRKVEARRVTTWETQI